MKKRINLQLISMAVIAILFTLLSISGVFYDLFCKQIGEDLRIYTDIFEGMGASEKELADFRFQDEKIRVTLIAPDGTVLYDNWADSAALENHKDRPEVTEAFAGQEGFEVRKSSTMNTNTFYYARLLQDGTVLRIAKEASSIESIFVRAVPVVLAILASLLLGGFAMAHFLTKRLIEPIEQLARNLDQVEEIDAYEELQPFIAMIRKQHEDIVKNARVRQEFTANVSHELKTPLTSISGYAELIESGMASDEDVVRFAKGIHKNSNRLLTLINDIIRLSELDGVQQEEAFESVDLYALARTCIDMLQLNADSHHVSLTLEGCSSCIPADRQMMEELLYNLCDNAIRYNNENGSVTMRIYPKREKTILEVQDTGIGIPKEHQERIFERFYRVDKSRSKSTGGTGLGLAIVKHILVKHHANLELESKEGQGTKITVTFG